MALQERIEILKEVRNVEAEFVYPDYTNPSTLTVGLLAVRSAPDIRISYHFERDGWLIEQELCDYAGGAMLEGNHLSPKQPGVWKEVGFVQAWQLWNTCKATDCPHKREHKSSRTED